MARYEILRDGNQISVKVADGISIAKKEWNIDGKNVTGPITLDFSGISQDVILQEAAKSIIITLQSNLRDMGKEFCQSLKGKPLTYAVNEILAKKERQTLSDEQKARMNEAKNMSNEEWEQYKAWKAMQSTGKGKGTVTRKATK